jgi:hypothetical protein
MRSLLNEDTSAIASIIKALKSVNAREIIDDIKSTSNKYAPKQKSQEYMGGSISQYTKNLIMSFPMLCDDTLSIETAQMLSKANERNIADMFQLLFSSMSVNGKDGVEVLSRFHKNIDKMGMDDIIDVIDDTVDTINTIKETMKESAVDRAIERQYLNEMVTELKKPASIYEDSINETSLMDYIVSTNMYGETIVKEDYYSNYYDDASNDRIDNINKDYPYDDDKNSKFNKAKDQIKQGLEEDKFKYQRDNNDMNYNLKVLQKRIIDSQIKKSNELQPTLMIVNYNVLSDDGKTLIEKKTFMAGIKSRLISVGALDISDRVVVKNKTKINFKNFLRATTGEINFVKDFLFCIDQAKINARNAVKKGESAKMWDLLEKRASKNNMRKLNKSKNDASAIASLVVNQETVNYIKAQYKIDLNNVKTAIDLMGEYNLLALVIADEANEYAKFLYDGNKAFEMVAYSSMERDMADKSYKKVINII